MIRRQLLCSLPPGIKKWLLQRLCRMTASAFACQTIPLRGRTFAACLDEYARFSREAAEDWLQGNCPDGQAQRRLYAQAYVFGRRLRRLLFVRTWAEAVEVLQAVYQLLGIDFRTGDDNSYIISSCFFSRHYNEAVCRQVSALDEGLTAGLCGGRLRFQERITAGSGCCRGELRQEGEL